MTRLNDLLNRRAFLDLSAAILAGAPIFDDFRAFRASLRHATEARANLVPHWEVFTEEEARNVQALADLIMPTDETPGATDAGVVFFIDHSIATWAASQRQLLTEGLASLNAEVKEHQAGAIDFASLRNADQTVLLHSVETTPFFQTMRLLTLLGMFSLPSYGGNRLKCGWRLIGFEDRYMWRPPFGYYDAESMRETR